MPHRVYVHLFVVLIYFFGVCPLSHATDDKELLAAFNQIYDSKFEFIKTASLNDYNLHHKDLNVIFIDGRLSFIEPVTIEGENIVYGAYFEGDGIIEFSPQVSIEKEQLYRFYHTDSLNRYFDKMLLLFSPEIYKELVSASVVDSTLAKLPDAGDARDMMKDFTRDEQRFYVIQTLKALTTSAQNPYLLLNVEPDKGGRVFYMFDPDVREEVVFQKQFREPGINFMETVCRYSQYLDPNYNNINGFPKEKLKTKHYNIEALIENSGKFIASSDMSFEVLMSGTQLITMLLHEELKVDSIVDSAGNKISFLRYEKDKYKSSPIYLFFNRPLNYGESVTLKFYYQGDIIEREMGEFFVNAGADWYPTYGYNQRATFDMTFKTGKEMEFIASGNLLEKKKSDDTLITKWKVIPPAKNISFNIGNMKRYRFDEEVIAPVNVYYSRDFHNEMARYLSKEMIATGKDMQNQVAEDIINSMKLFEHYFGEYPYPEINVSEILYSHGEAFPAFLHLGFDTWVNTDPWGNDRMFRAHEVAHQWWGIGVGYKTYHDQWLSEGFAEYSSLLYLQAVSGNDKFLEKIKEYRDDIFSARKYFLGSGEESGPIALGYRTSSSKTRGDYGLIIYKKSAMVLHMLRNLLIDFSNMNEDLFFQMLKEFYQKYRGNIVTTDDFKLFTEKYTGIDMTWFFNQWVYRSEIPTFDFSYDIAIDNKGKYTANCHITTKDVAEDFKMYLPVEIEIDKDSKAYIRVLVDSPNFDFTLPNLPKKPKKLILNPFESVLAKVNQ